MWSLLFSRAISNVSCSKFTSKFQVDKVLDLCTAPGGKTTQLVEVMENKGFILANEISLKRAKALLKNVELMAVENTVVTSTTPVKLATFYGSYFDAVLVDAPCSGEGMFRKEKGLLKTYEKFWFRKHGRLTEGNTGFTKPAFKTRRLSYVFYLYFLTSRK